MASHLENHGFLYLFLRYSLYLLKVIIVPKLDQYVPLHTLTQCNLAADFASIYNVLLYILFRLRWFKVKHLGHGEVVLLHDFLVSSIL